MHPTAMVMIIILSLPGLAGAEDGDVLFSNDHDAIIHYLTTHMVPDFPYVDGETGGPTAGEKEYVDQTIQAQKVFAAGDASMRLAIARAIGYANTKCWFEQWKQCGKDDHDAREYLTGWALDDSSDDERKEVVDWLLLQKGVSDMSRIIAHLEGYDLFKNLDAVRARNLCQLLVFWSDNHGKSIDIRDPRQPLQDRREMPRVGVLILHLFPFSRIGNSSAFAAAAHVRTWANPDELKYIDGEMKSRDPQLPCNWFPPDPLPKGSSASAVGSAPGR